MMNIVRCPVCSFFVAAPLLSFDRKKLQRTTRARIPFAEDVPPASMCHRCWYLHDAPMKPSMRQSDLLPISLRMNADPRFTGAGVTIAFIDSGFYPHPDLIKPRERILA